MNVKQAWRLTKQSIGSWSEDYAPSMGAALSYYTLFSIAPLLIIVIAVAGLFFGADAVRGVIFAQLQALMGTEGAEAIREMLSTASDAKTGGLAAIVSVIGLLIGATTVFNELQNDLDRIWRAPARVKSSGVWNLLRTRLLSFGMVLAVAFLLTVSLVTSAALATIGKWWGAWFSGWEVLAHVLDIVVNFGLLTAVFALIYKVIPRVQVGWHDVWIGAAVTALLFVLGKFLIGLYLGKSDMTSSFGAAGSMVLVMVWVYYSAQIFLFGAEFTWVYANLYGSRRKIAKKEGTMPSAPQENTGALAADSTPGTASHAAGPSRANDFVPVHGNIALTRHRSKPAHSVASLRTAAPLPADTATSQRKPLSGPRDHRVAIGLAIATAVAIGLTARFKKFYTGHSFATLRPGAGHLK